MHLNNPDRRILHWLYIFYLSAKFKSMQLAAEHMNSHISTLSDAMTNFEYYLGVDLRIPRRLGFKLTPAGKRLYARVRFSMENLESVMNDLDSFSELYNEAGVEKCAPNIVKLHAQEVILPRGEVVKARMVDDLLSLIGAVDYSYKYPLRGAPLAKKLSQRIESRLSQTAKEELELVRSSESA